METESGLPLATVLLGIMMITLLLHALSVIIPALPAQLIQLVLPVSAVINVHYLAAAVLVMQDITIMEERVVLHVTIHVPHALPILPALPASLPTKGPSQAAHVPATRDTMMVGLVAVPPATTPANPALPIPPVRLVLAPTKELFQAVLALVTRDTMITDHLGTAWPAIIPADLAQPSLLAPHAIRDTMIMDQLPASLAISLAGPALPLQPAPPAAVRIKGQSPVVPALVISDTMKTELAAVLLATILASLALPILSVPPAAVPIIAPSQAILVLVI